MKWILFIYLLSFDSRGGMTITSAEFNNEAACQAAGERIGKEFKTFFTQEPKTLCVEKGEPSAVSSTSDDLNYKPQAPKP